MTDRILLTGRSAESARRASPRRSKRAARAVIGQATRPGDATRSPPTSPIRRRRRCCGKPRSSAPAGAIDVLVNNAGLFAANPLDASDIAWLDAWEDTLRINLTAAAQLSRVRGAPLAGERDAAGASSTSPAAPGIAAIRPTHWHYAAAKGGMLALHKTIARAYAARGHPQLRHRARASPTPAMAGDYLASRGGPGLLADIPLGRVATPEEIAAMVAFCALDAPPSMTGAMLDANGASYVR